MSGISSYVHLWSNIVAPDRKLEDKALYFDENSRIQILDTMEQVPDAEKDQNAAFLVCVTLF